MDGRRPLNFMLGDHPAAHGNKVVDNTLETTGQIVWTNDRWASILEHVDFLHMVVAGKKQSDLDIVKAAVDELGLKHREKIQMYFNLTNGRRHYEHSSPKIKQSRLRYNSQT